MTWKADQWLLGAEEVNGESGKKKRQMSSINFEGNRYFQYLHHADGVVGLCQNLSSCILYEVILYQNYFNKVNE